MLEREGRRAFPPPPTGPVPTYEEVLEMGRGDAGRAVIEALEQERAESW